MKFFVEGDEYKILGQWKSNRHLFGVGPDAPPLMIFGTDELGRDILSRTFHGSTISLSIGLVGVILSFVLGISLGGLSGYFGGIIDEIIQRIIDFLLSIPQLPFFMQIGSSIATRVVGHKDLLCHHGDLVSHWLRFPGTRCAASFWHCAKKIIALAAQAAGASQPRIHLSPSPARLHQPPDRLAHPSSSVFDSGRDNAQLFGVGYATARCQAGVSLLQDAQDMVVVAQQPWRLIPGLFVVIAASIPITHKI